METINGGDEVLRSGSCLVTRRQLKTLRRTYQISRIEKTEVRRPALVICVLLAAALTAFAYRWRELLDYPSGEHIGVGLTVAGLLVVGLRLGALVVQSKALEEIAVWGDYGRLRRLRAAVDQAVDLADAELRTLDRKGESR
jgi:hypothetical protein